MNRGAPLHRNSDFVDCRAWGKRFALTEDRGGAPSLSMGKRMGRVCVFAVLPSGEGGVAGAMVLEL